jgi:hypothetical protein
MSEDAASQDGARLEEISRELDKAVAALRAEQLDAEEATRIAAHCAELASEAALALERLARSEPLESAPGQEELL